MVLFCVDEEIVLLYILFHTCIQIKTTPSFLLELWASCGNIYIISFSLLVVNKEKYGVSNYLFIFYCFSQVKNSLKQIYNKRFIYDLLIEHIAYNGCVKL